MKAEDARQIYYGTHLSGALEAFYEVIRNQAPFGLSGNFYETAINYDYAILRLVADELTKQGYTVHYSDGEIRSTEIFEVCWEE